MRHVPIFFLTFIASTALADDFRWLEGEWISDAAATMAANPEFGNLDAATYSTFQDMYGRLRWRFDNGAFQVIYPEEPEEASHSSSYSVREWESGETELLIEGVAGYRISRTEAGFCVEAPFDPPKSKPEGFPGIECFKRYGA